MSRVRFKVRDVLGVTMPVTGAWRSPCSDLSQHDRESMTLKYISEHMPYDVVTKPLVVGSFEGVT